MRVGASVLPGLVVLMLMGVASACILGCQTTNPKEELFSDNALTTPPKKPCSADGSPGAGTSPGGTAVRHSKSGASQLDAVQGDHDKVRRLCVAVCRENLQDEEQGKWRMVRSFGGYCSPASCVPHTSDASHVEQTCARIIVDLTQGQDGWGGVAWLASGWMPVTNGPNLHQLLGMDPADSKHGIRLCFSARSLGKKPVTIIGKVGGQITTGNYPDSLLPAAESGVLQLGPEWATYSIDLSRKDLSCMQSAFCVVVGLYEGNPKARIEFLVRDVYFQRYQRGHGRGGIESPVQDALTNE